MKKIGGFFELELPKVGSEYHSRGVRYNLARNALLAYVEKVGCKRIYLPSFCCSSLSEALKGSEVEQKFYHVNSRLEVDVFPELSENELFLYVNYFGIKSAVVPTLVERYGDNLVVDNSQSFYAIPEKLGASIYSARKFFGVPDGAYLYAPEGVILNEVEGDADFVVDHLIQRIELGPEESYSAYRVSERNLRQAGARPMSAFTRQVLTTVDDDYVRKSRQNNFNALHQMLGEQNCLAREMGVGFELNAKDAIPMVYPFLIENGESLRDYLIQKKIFVAMYWADVLKSEFSSELEKSYAKKLLPLPIDQRYDVADMKYIVDTIKDFYA